MISRQRAWGVPITVFQHKETGEVIPSAKFAKSGELMARIRQAITEKGADAWFEAGAAGRFLAGLVDNPADWQPATDILDVWFDSGSTHAFTLEDPEAFPGLAGIKRQRDGGATASCTWKAPTSIAAGSSPRCWSVRHARARAVRRRAHARLHPRREGRGEDVEVEGQHALAAGADEDLGRRHPAPVGGVGRLHRRHPRFGPAILQGTAESYRKLRNTLRWMLGTLAHYDPKQKVGLKAMPELERLMLHRLAELDEIVREAYAEYDYKRVVAVLSHFMNTDLSAFYFDVRKDALYCEPVPA